MATNLGKYSQLITAVGILLRLGILLIIFYVVFPNHAGTAEAITSIPVWLETAIQKANNGGGLLSVLAVYLSNKVDALIFFLSLSFCIEMTLWALLKAKLRSSSQILSLLAISPALLIGIYLLSPGSLLLAVTGLCLYFSFSSSKPILFGLFSAILILSNMGTIILVPSLFALALRSDWRKSGFSKFVISFTLTTFVTLLALWLTARNIFSQSFVYPLSDGDLTLPSSALVFFFGTVFALFAAGYIFSSRRAPKLFKETILVLGIGTIPVFEPENIAVWTASMFLLVMALPVVPRKYSIGYLAVGSLFATQWIFSSTGYVSFTLAPLCCAILLVYIVAIGNTALKTSDHYSLRLSPLSLLVSGDSGTGKDTLCTDIAGVFGLEKSAFLLGDDYHTHERMSSAWDARTHLDPSMNNLTKFASDAWQLIRGNSVWSRHYDHGKGKFTLPRQTTSAEFVAISGLHALWLNEVRRRSDLSVFLDMDNSLRTWLKVRRDTTTRNHSIGKVLESIAKREKDRNVYVQPQRDLADLVLTLLPEDETPVDTSDLKRLPNLRLVIDFKEISLGSRVVRSMNSLLGKEASLTYLEGGLVERVEIRNVNKFSSQDVKALIESLVGHRDEIFSETPIWQNGSQGVCQFVVLLTLLYKRQLYGSKLRGN